MNDLEGFVSGLKLGLGIGAMACAFVFCKYYTLSSVREAREKKEARESYRNTDKGEEVLPNLRRDSPTDHKY